MWATFVDAQPQAHSALFPDVVLANLIGETQRLTVRVRLHFSVEPEELSRAYDLETIHLRTLFVPSPFPMGVCTRVVLDFLCHDVLKRHSPNWTLHGSHFILTLKGRKL